MLMSYMHPLTGRLTNEVDLILVYVHTVLQIFLGVLRQRWPLKHLWTRVLSGVFWIVAEAWRHLWCWVLEFIYTEQVWFHSCWSVKEWTVHCHSWRLV